MDLCAYAVQMHPETHGTQVRSGMNLIHTHVSRVTYQILVKFRRMSTKLRGGMQQLRYTMKHHTNNRNSGNKTGSNYVERKP
jgi:hypothetical protein